MFRFFKDFFIYGVASIMGKLAAILLIPVYTGVLTKEEYGAMALIVSCKGIIDLFSNLNIHSGIIRDYYETEDDRTKLISTGFFSILGFSNFTLLLVLLSTNFFIEKVLGIAEFKSSFILMALSIPAGSLMSYFSILTRFKKKPIQYSIGSFVQLLVQISISLIGVVYLELGIPSIFLGVLMGEIVSIIYFSFLNRSYIDFCFERKYLKRALLFAIPTLPAILAGWIDSSLGQIIVGRFIDLKELGVYSLSLQIASVFTLISAAFQNVWSPYLYENYNKDTFSLEVTRLFSTITTMLLGISIVFSFLAKEFIILLSNDSYVNASLYLPILCIAMSFYMIFPFATSGIVIARNTYYIGLGYLFGSMFNICSMLLLIKYIGVLAAPVSLCISRIISFVFMWNKTSKYLHFKCPISLLVSIVICSLLSFLCNYFSLSFTYRSICCLILLSFVILKLYRNNGGYIRFNP